MGHAETRIVFGISAEVLHVGTTLGQFLLQFVHDIEAIEVS